MNRDMDAKIAKAPSLTLPRCTGGGMPRQMWLAREWWLK
jgi:hypothetical protein